MTPLLLLTLQHTMSFTQGYQMVAATCIFLIVLFVLSITKSFTYGFYLLLILVSIYAAQFINIEMPEYSLFAISAAGVWITILLMLMSFNIKEDK
ncbi:MAG: inner membrane protein involved in colicin E2 resistance [Cocleimonas sp.]|jgi:inner membrane protein involved in colicin E2 resistance